MGSSSARPSDKYIPFYILGFFVLLVGVLVWFTLMARHNYPGEITDEAYDKGLKYNLALKGEEEQEKLGWKSETRFTHHGLDVNIRFSFTDSTGKPITDAVAKAWFIRPTLAGHDEAVTLISDGKGNYTGSTKLAWPGYWKVHISATSDGHNYQKMEELNLQ